MVPQMRSAKCLLLMMWLWTEAISECPSEIRVRRPWHSLDEKDQMLFVYAFQELRTQSILAEFIEAHDKATQGDTINIHESSQNFFWHSYWLYLFEDAVRDLGGEYECFALPYWDVTHDGDYWWGIDVEARNIADIPIYNSNLGGDGDVNDNYCVTDELWSVDQYTTDFLCADDEVDGQCCLKRFHIEDQNKTLFPGSEFAAAVLVDGEYAAFGAFQSRIKAMHGDIHDFIASVGYHTHFSTADGEAVCDPLFPLFHSFLDYIRLLHIDCNQFDVVAAEDLDDFMPFSYEIIDTELDFPMDFSCLCDNSDGEKKRLCSDHDITARLMYDISPNSRWNVVYELGDFWENNEALHTECLDSLNETWWVLESLNETRWVLEDPHDAAFAVSILSARWLATETELAPIAIMLILAASTALMGLYALTMRLKKEKQRVTGGSVYGTV